MCSHDDCRVEVLPDGQVDEYHEFTYEQLKDLQDSINRLVWKLQWVRATLTPPREVVFDGKSRTSSQG